MYIILTICFHSEGVQPVKIPVHKVTYQDYNKHNGNITQLQEIGRNLLSVKILNFVIYYNISRLPQNYLEISTIRFVNLKYKLTKSVVPSPATDNGGSAALTGY